MKDLLFSARGRLNRSRFWLAGLAAGIVASIVVTVLLRVLWAVAPGEYENGSFHVEGAAAVPYIVLILAYLVVCVWSDICLGIKRYHDMDKSGAWMLVMFIPVVGGLIYFIQAGCLRGTVGTNRYGTDPLLNPA